MTDLSDEEAAEFGRTVIALLACPDVVALTIDKSHSGQWSTRTARYEASVRTHGSRWTHSDRVLSPDGAVELLAAKVREGSHV